MGLDVDKFLDFVTKEQKAYLVPFVISLPIVYTVLFLYVDGYAQYAFLERIIFAIAVDIVVMAMFVIAAMIGGGVKAAEAGGKIVSWFWCLWGGNFLFVTLLGGHITLCYLTVSLVVGLVVIFIGAVTTRCKK